MGADGCGRLVKRRFADIDRLVQNASLLFGALGKQQTSLRRCPCAKFDQRESRAVSRSLQNFSGVFGQDAAFGAGEVILRQFGDLLEKLRAALIVEEPRAERFRCASEA